jgi:hypothetical protein
MDPGGAAEQVSGQALSGGAIGGGLSGLAALAALLLLLFLKRKKKEPEQVEETVETGSNTVDEDDAYISEYGLSDGVQPVDADQDDEDLPQAMPEEPSEGSDRAALSERSPDDFDAAEADPDEI